GLYRAVHPANVVDGEFVEAAATDVWLDVQPDGLLVVPPGGGPDVVAVNVVEPMVEPRPGGHRRRGRHTPRSYIVAQLPQLLSSHRAVAAVDGLAFALAAGVVHVDAAHPHAIRTL